jgi:hypothetical protein
MAYLEAVDDDDDNLLTNDNKIKVLCPYACVFYTFS